MNADELIAELDRLGIRVEAHGERLHYGPKSMVTRELIDQMKAHKSELLLRLDRKPDTKRINVFDPFEVWQEVLNKVAGDPEFTPDIVNALRNGIPKWVRKKLDHTPSKE